MEKQQVGQVNYKDSQGRSVGSADVYQDVPVTSYRQVWYTLQGPSRIEDEDFFRIAGREDLAEEARTYRHRGLVLTRVGMGLMVGGSATVLGGAAAVP